MITKEERAELRRLLARAAAYPTPWSFPEARDLAVAAPKILATLDAADERIAGLEKDCDIYQDANIRLTKESEQVRATLSRKSRALKHEIRKLHRAREQDWEAGKRWRKEFIEDHARLGKECAALQASVVELAALGDTQCAAIDTLKARIAELEAAAQWRPMDTAPRDGTLILVSGRGPDGEDCEVIEWTDEAQLVLEEELSGYPEVAIAWLPIPALPEGGV